MLPLTLPVPNEGLTLVLGITDQDIDEITHGLVPVVDLAQMGGLVPDKIVLCYKPTLADLREEFATLLGRSGTFGGRG